MLPTISVEITGVEEAFNDFVHRIDTELEVALVDIGNAVAERAKREHTFTNRTGDLERSLRAELFSSTRPLGGGLSSVLVVGDTDYGEYVEGLHGRRFAYLDPAWRREQDAAVKRIERAFYRATLHSDAWSPR